MSRGGEGDHHRMGLAASTSHVPYSVWEAEAGRPSKTVLSASSESVILLTRTAEFVPRTADFLPLLADFLPHKPTKPLSD